MHTTLRGVPVWARSLSAMFFSFDSLPTSWCGLVHCNEVATEIYVVVTTLEMNISAVNGKDEISWKAKNTMKNQLDSLSILVRECTIQVL